MTFLLFLILLLVVLFWPFIKLGWRVRRTMNEQRRRWQQAADVQREQQEQRERRSHKKIDPDVGEYVPFTEIELSAEERAAQAGAEQPRFRAEEQISDVKWVDIKE